MEPVFSRNLKFSKNYYFLRQIVPVTVVNNNGAISQKKTSKKIWIVSYEQNLKDELRDTAVKNFT